MRLAWSGLHWLTISRTSIFRFPKMGRISRKNCEAVDASREGLRCLPGIALFSADGFRKLLKLPVVRLEVGVRAQELIELGSRRNWPLHLRSGKDFSHAQEPRKTKVCPWLLFGGELLSFQELLARGLEERRLGKSTGAFPLRGQPVESLLSVAGNDSFHRN